MTLRCLSGGDAAALQALRLRALRESPEAFGSSYAEEVDRPLDVVVERLGWDGPGKGASFGAFGEDGRLLGMGTLRREPQLRARHRAGIYGMYVAPEARGQGQGRALLQAMLDHARGMEGVARLELGVTTTNTAARALYLSFGFVPYGVQPDAYRSGGRSWDTELMTMEIG